MRLIHKTQTRRVLIVLVPILYFTDCIASILYLNFKSYTVMKRSM